MSDDAAREDACREYQSSLEDLTFNSKPHINMLTILAEENLHFAKDIVAIIEAQIAKVPPPEKLPVLYLVDSIVKNVGGEYLDAFAKNLVTTFLLVFGKVDDNTRKSLFKLRSTWDDIFPLKKLYALDVRVNSIDPAWPVKPLPPNMNASIHVNPKFLKPTEEVTLPRGNNTPQPSTNPVVSEKSLTQEQAIRQQLLAKQKQLLELQQKKIELELEQTKAQLAANQMVSTASPSVNTVSQPGVGAKSTHLPNTSSKPWLLPQPESKVSTRDPRLNRAGQPTLHVNEQGTNKKESHNMGTTANTSDKKSTPEKPSKFEKMKIPKKDFTEEKQKSKSPSPLNKGAQSRSKNSELENVKAEVNKRDPRLRKHLYDKTEDDCKEKKRFSDKKDRDDSAKISDYRSAGARNKLVNGSVNKYERNETLDKTDSKTNKANARKRSRSRSRSPLLHSPKRKDRRSPKRRTRSISSSPPKFGKGRQMGMKHSHPEEYSHHTNIKEERSLPKKTTSEPRRPKRSLEERPTEPRDSHSPRLPSEVKENANKRWRSGWEENKHLKQPDENLVCGKSGPQRHKPSWSGNQRGIAPRPPKQHRLSVDANLQIPEVLNSASKRDLLKKASKRLADGEISHDDFLNVAHQIKQLFQYQEEKQRCDSWEGSVEDVHFGTRKKPLLSTPPLQQGNLSDAEISYYEHKAKLRRTQVQHQGAKDCHSPYSERPQNMRSLYEDTDIIKGGSELQKRYGEMAEGVKLEDSSKSCLRHEELKKNDRPSLSPVHFDGPSGKSPVSGFDCSSNLAVECHEVIERELSPSKRFDIPSSSEHSLSQSDSDAQLSLEVASGHPEPSGQGRSAQQGQLHCASPGQTPPHVSDGLHLSRYDGPQITQRFDGQQSLFDGPASHKGQPRLDGSTRPHLQGRFDGAGRLESQTGSRGPSRFDGQQQQCRSRFDGPQASRRFDGPLIHKGPERFEGPNQYDNPSMLPGPQRFGESQSMGRYDGPRHQQGAGRFEGPVRQQGPSRFDGPGPIFDSAQMQPGRFEGPLRFENPHMQQSTGGFEGLVHFGGSQGQKCSGRYVPSSQQGRVRFDGPANQPCVVRFEQTQRALGPMRYEGQQQVMSRFDCTPGQQVPPRFCGPPNVQNQLRPQGPSMFDANQSQNPLSNPCGQQSNFSITGHGFSEPLNVFAGAAPSFQGQQTLSQDPSFSVQPVTGATGFNSSFVRPVSSFYNPGAPVVNAGNTNTSVPGGNIMQPMNILSGLGKTDPYSQGQPYLSVQQTPVSYNQTGSQFASSESHFGQVDVNDLLTKLISTGIIKLPPSDAPASDSATPPPTQPAVEEEEEEEQDDDQNVPDLTSFTLEDMKQRYDSVVTKLYTGIQCYSCGMRFTASQTDVYADHLDWHYRQNRSEKDISKKVTHRRWYYSLTDWIEFEEIADLEERAKSQFFEKVNEEVVQKTQEAAKEKECLSVRAAPDVVGESCEICQEQFEMYWEEEEEEWHLKNAIRVDEKTYHPSCYEDYKNTSSFMDCTPSPNKALLENPLNVFIKEETEQSSCSGIKQELDVQDSCTEVNVKEEAD